MHRYAHAELEAFAQSIGERVLHTPDNPISLALTLSTLGAQPRDSSLEGSSEEHAASRPAGGNSRDEEQRPLSGVEATAGPAVGGAGGASGSSRAAEVEPEEAGHARQKRPVTFLGSMLFKRGVSGTRVVARGKRQSVAGRAFTGYGAHCDAYPHDYLTFAAALGTTEADVDEFVVRLRRCIEEFKRL